MTKKKERQSNIELLRIFSMIGVVSVSFHSKKHRKKATKRRKYDIIGARKITAGYQKPCTGG